MQLPNEEKIRVFKNNGEGYETFQFVVLISVFLSGVIYVLLSGRLLFKHKKRIRNQFSDIEKINLRWLQFLTGGLGVVWFLVIFTRSDTLIFTAVSIFVILIGFFGMQQKEIFKNTVQTIVPDTPKTVSQDIKLASPSEREEALSVPENSKAKEQTDKEKYLSSGLSSTMAEQLHAKLNLAMTEEKIYKNSDLSLSQLAEQLDTHPNYLSQILNEKEKKSFYDYINIYRVNEFKRLIEIPSNQNLTLLAVAYDCGFNSKSSFNRYFKKCTDQTPSQFVKTLKTQA